MFVLFRVFGKGAAHIGDAASVLKGGTVVWNIEGLLDLDRILYPSSRRTDTSEVCFVLSVFIAR